MAGAQAYRKQRLLDSLRFLYELQAEFYARYVQAVRASGYTGELLGSNWQAGRAFSHFANLYTDYEVGRLIDSLRTSGELDNTLVMYVVGDNGASAEGGLEGTFSEIASLIGVQIGLESSIKRIDEIGGPTSEPHVPVGWAWAMDAPFQWTKQVASHFGGTRNPMVVHWPKGFKNSGPSVDGANTMIPSRFQLPPRPLPASQGVDGLPAVMGTFLSFIA